MPQTGQLTYTPSQGGIEPINLGRWAPGFTSEIDGKWGVHQLPGQRGQLMEDLGDGALITPVQLIFSGPTAITDYNTVLDAITKTRRGTLMHPRRGKKNVIVRKVREEVRWTERGDTTIVDITFEESTLNQPDQFKGGPSVYASNVQNQAKAANDAAAAQSARIARRAFSYAIIALRRVMATAQFLVNNAAAGCVSYADAALLAFSQSAFDAALQIQLRGLPPSVQAAQVAIRKCGPPSEVQPTIIALERMLYSCAQLDAAIRANQPVPVETEITAPGGQSVYAFVMQYYAGKQKTPAEMRDLVRLILRLNKNIRTPNLIPQGTIVVRPAA